VKEFIVDKEKNHRHQMYSTCTVRDLLTKYRGQKIPKRIIVASKNKFKYPILKLRAQLAQMRRSAIEIYKNGYN
jgi:hypothetical protein